MSRHAPHVVIDARMVGDGGIGTYLQNLVPLVAAQRPDWRFTLLGDSKKLRHLATAPNATTRSCTSRIYGMREQIELALRTPKDATLFWAPHYNVPLLVRGARLAVTVHDLCHLALPEFTGGIVRQAYARSMFSVVRRKAACVLFDSDFTRREMARLVGVPRGDQVVTHLGVADAWRLAGDAPRDRPVNGPYLIYVGNFKRHKNVPMLLRAFGRVCRQIPHRLVLVGRSQGLRADPAIAAAAQQLGDRVLCTGELPDAAVRTYVASADALVTASLYEGFGLPPLEAMAAGTPCLVSRAGSLPEICGDAALYCDPRDEADVASRLLEIATQPALRRTLAHRGREHAAQFEWSRTATLTSEAFEAVFRRDERKGVKRTEVAV